MNGFIRNGHDVYFLSDRDTSRATTMFGSRKLGTRHCNRVFLDTCYNYCPDIVLYGVADIITAQSSKAARQMLPHARFAQFHVDQLSRPKTVHSIRAKLPWVDATFVTTAGPALERFHTDHGRVAFIPNPVDPSIDYPRCWERVDQPNDVFWAVRAANGSFPGDPRIDLPLFLERTGQVAIDYHGMNGKRELFGVQYFQAIEKAKMGLNISQSNIDRTQRASDEDLYLYASDRIAHYMGSGLLTFSTRDNRLEQLFEEDKEMVFFSTPEELLEKVLHYKTHDHVRRRIAEAGWRKYHACFSNRLVAQFIIDIVSGSGLTTDYEWPTECY
jgi:hypothetical protein